MSAFLTWLGGKRRLAATIAERLERISLLRNASEVMGDDLGNENGLCESSETCLYTPNIGAYQGHGDLVSAGSFTDGTLTGITLLKYETNGY